MGSIVRSLMIVGTVSSVVFSPFRYASLLSIISLISFSSHLSVTSLVSPFQATSPPISSTTARTGSNVLSFMITGTVPFSSIGLSMPFTTIVGLPICKTIFVFSCGFAVSLSAAQPVSVRLNIIISDKITDIVFFIGIFAPSLKIRQPNSLSRFPIIFRLIFYLL